MPKPNPGKTGDDKNEHYDNETFFSDQSGPSEAAHAYGHGAVSLDSIDPVFVFTVRGTRFAVIPLPQAARR